MTEQTKTQAKTPRLKIYVASSWRNKYYVEQCRAIQEAGFDVYDFRNPREGEHGFHWSEIDPNWRDWTREEYREALKHEHAKRGFRDDMRALEWCDALVLISPCGRSAHLELGHAIGSEKFVVIQLNEEQEPELMYKGADALTLSIEETLEQLFDYERALNGSPLLTNFELDVLDYARRRHPGRMFAGHFRKFGEELGEFVEAACNAVEAAAVATLSRRSEVEGVPQATLEQARRKIAALADKGSDVSLVLKMMLASVGVSLTRHERIKMRKNEERLVSGQRMPDALMLDSPTLFNVARNFEEKESEQL